MSAREKHTAATGEQASAAPPLLGAHVAGGVTRFGAYVTTARTVSVRLVEAAGGGATDHPMRDLGDGHFLAELPGVGHGARYRLVLDGRELPDPYARFLPDGVHGPAMVVEPRHPWRHPNVARPLREHVLYELHVGTFTEAGTYVAARERLADLAALGVTAVELMPIAAFAGARGWGYDGVAPFAPFAPYGTPDELRALVDAAHGLGLAVLLDVVYNHLGPAGNYLGAFSGDYFTSEVRNAWGDAPDLRKGAMRRLIVENARYWLEDFRMDGLRLDATHAIVDPSAEHVLAQLARQAHALVPPRLVVAEDDRNEPALVEELGLDGVWADDFHHTLRVTLTGERDGYYAAYPRGAAAVAETINGGFYYRGQIYPTRNEPRGKDAPGLPAEAFVYCIQNHDQVGNRAMGDRLGDVVPVEAYLSATALLLFLPMTPMLFMGEEWMARAPFQYFTDHDAELGPKISQGRREEFKGFAAFADPSVRERIPDPQALATFTRSRLDWTERARAPHDRVLRAHRDLLRLRREDPVLRDAPRARLEATSAGDLLVVRRWTGTDTRVLLANLGARQAPLPSLPLPPTAATLFTTRERGTAGGEDAPGDPLGPWQSRIIAAPSAG